MPIIIENLSGISFDDIPQKYRVRVNSEEICRFEHTRKDGLAECLRKAAEAVDKDADREGGGQRKENEDAGF